MTQMSGQPALLEVKNLRTYFRTRAGVAKAVDGVSFSLQQGRTLGIVGESGSGKSVTMMSIVRLIAKPAGRIESGEILFEGKDLLKLTDEEMRRIRGDQIAVVTQDPMTSLNPVYSIGNQLEEPLRLHQGIKTKSVLRDKVIAGLRRVGIPAPEMRVRSYPHQMSGGQRQRVVTAMALECHPSLLLCDEPTTALDVTVQMQVLRLLREIQREQRLSMIIVSHDLAVIARVCDDVAVMYAGRIVEKAGLVSLFENPSHPYTKALMRSLNGETDGKGRLHAIEGQPPDVRQIKRGCPFAPRCREAMDICTSEFPPEVVLSPNHTTSCWAVSAKIGSGPR
ncbi:ABC transporter ATP-binding protein [Chelatococcus reniformis]|uniref:Dipeptide/oligopeptide/nickel ABC transporter ATP-binding protein n=1 Tax=Chelatococcus reniformis TaxID=1494448 RepID=A0A916TYB9_9HYPH|nr:ABC transporter ATP-binding protein [Chelatococcus reniformis]GGC48422.1 dipeptide/oligopeptide/nickel ABC transporter ATP-binding protein [Chelatococcus reniformis]